MTEVWHRGYRIRVTVDQLVTVDDCNDLVTVNHSDLIYSINTIEFGPTLKDPIQALVDLKKAGAKPE